jgi:hypothetical protein
MGREREEEIKFLRTNSNVGPEEEGDTYYLLEQTEQTCIWILTTEVYKQT